MLLVDDPSGAQVKARRLGVARAGASEGWLVPVDLPAGRYVYRVEARAMDSGTDPTTPEAVSAAFVVLTPLPLGFPGRKAIAAAFGWAAGRDGDVAVAVVDTNGVVSGYREHRAFRAASLAKAILLVASLRRDSTPDRSTEAALTKMIEESDNGAAYTIFAHVGAKGHARRGRARWDERLRARRRAGSTPASRRPTRRGSSHELRGARAQDGPLAWRLLSSVITIQRWGIPAAAGPAGWKTYHKSGWLGRTTI